MARGVLTAAACVLTLVGSASAQVGGGASDPVTGSWGTDGVPFLELRFDGKNGVSGTVIWREGRSYEQRAPIGSGTFDRQTGALKLTGEAKDRDGKTTVRYVIEGKIENDVVAGTFQMGEGKGDFSFTRLSRGASTGAATPSSPAAQGSKPDPWQPVRFLAGTWEGTATGAGGAGTARRTYAFVLKDRYIHEKNTTSYPPQEQNKAGEVHEHWSFISYDRARATLVLRQFHPEGFVNQYVVNKAESTPKKLVFDSERFENYDNNARARETYDIVSADEFIETFELGDPGKPLEVYSRTHFKRVK